MFVCGDDADAERRVAELLESFGWPAERITDLGEISAARGTEMYVRPVAAPPGRAGDRAF